MNTLKYILILLVATTNICNSQTSKSNTIYNKDFKWSIIIPEGFEKVSAEDWQETENKGAEALGQTLGQEIVNRAKTIFVYKREEINTFESNYQPYDEAKDGNYLESCKKVNDVIFETFKSQIPNTKIEKSSSTEKIDGLVFQTFKIKILLPNEMELVSIMYSRLFGKKEFTVNITYADKAIGEKMLESWRNSKFKR